MNFADISYFFNRTSQPQELLRAHSPNLGYFEHFPAGWNCLLVKFAQSAWNGGQPGYQYHCFKGSPNKFWIPIRANRLVARANPDVVLVHGLIFPQQVLALRLLLPKRCRIMVQHHAERPGGGVLQRLQRLADKYIDGYLFSTKALATPWIERGIIQEEKVFEVMEGSSVMPQMPKADARRQLQLGDERIFLWVGRLDENKNPQTLLRAFRQFLTKHPGSKLYLVYGSYEEQRLSAMKNMMEESEELQNGIVLLGRLPRAELAYWYNAADYYVSTSFSEGSGYALIEAMSCGCVPVVSDIPSFRKITDNGRAGFLFDPSNENELIQKLCNLPSKPDDRLIATVLQQFEGALSFKAIAKQIELVCDSITRSR